MVSILMAAVLPHPALADEPPHRPSSVATPSDSPPLSSSTAQQRLRRCLLRHLIAPRWVLTAAHCVEDWTDSTTQDRLPATWAPARHRPERVDRGLAHHPDYTGSSSYIPRRRPHQDGLRRRQPGPDACQRRRPPSLIDDEVRYVASASRALDERRWHQALRRHPDLRLRLRYHPRRPGGQHLPGDSAVQP